MNELISPKYQMKLASQVENMLLEEYSTLDKIEYYIQKWYETKYGIGGSLREKFVIYRINDDQYDAIDIARTLHYMPEEILLKIAIDLGIDTPDFIPSIPIFKNEIKFDYKTASTTFEKAIKQIETDPSLAIGLANSALESIIKEILNDERVHSKIKGKETLYNLASEILKVFQIFPNADMPIEIRNIGSSLLSINQYIEKLRSEKTNVHGKTSEEYVIQDSMYAHFIINSVTTIGLFLISYYKKKFPKIETNNINDDLPF